MQTHLARHHMSHSRVMSDTRRSSYKLQTNLRLLYPVVICSDCEIFSTAAREQRHLVCNRPNPRISSPRAIYVCFRHICVTRSRERRVYDSLSRLMTHLRSIMRVRERYYCEQTTSMLDECHCYSIRELRIRPEASNLTKMFPTASKEFIVIIVTVHLCVNITHSDVTDV